MKKKSYNPFKMVGSWVGAVALFVIGMTGVLPSSFFAPIYWFVEGRGSLYLIPPYLLIVGFLIGWGINVWIIKNRRRK